MDFATIIGLLAGIGLLLGAILMASDLGPFIDYPSLMMVGGGMAAAALMSFPIQNVAAIFRVVMNCFFVKVKDPQEMIAEIVRFAEIARREGILALENEASKARDPFMVQAIQLAVDGTDPALIEAILMSEVESIESRHSDGKALFDNLGKYGPAFGMIGTLVGLIIMLKNMNDPASIGPAMAVALLTTMYGAVSANLFALPMAEKLGRRSKEEVALKMIVIRGIMSIQSGDNPRIVEQKLKAFLPHRKRQVSGTAAKSAA